MAIALGAGSDLLAQEGGKSGGSPLDTLMHTRLWADVPEAKDFVRQSRPPDDSLDYRPTSGSDPQRPKPRSKAELEALQSELEHAATGNQKNVGRSRPDRLRTAPAIAAAGQNTNQNANKAKLGKTQTN